jgi:hypothetical protein
VCGPPGMADEARAVVHQILKNGKMGVAYFEETLDGKCLLHSQEVENIANVY